MLSGAVLGTTSTCSWLPLRCCNCTACRSNSRRWFGVSVPVVSTTGASSAGIDASVCAQASQGSNASSTTSQTPASRRQDVQRAASRDAADATARSATTDAERMVTPAHGGA
ncbi:hypothetical protein SB85_08745 [Xanthomonas sacchari]|nr:hypothetical protein SB85_08745 [Xanthomonas sacchari]